VTVGISIRDALKYTIEDNVKNILSQNIDIHSSINNIKTLEQGVDAHFMAIIRNLSLNFLSVRASDYWSESRGLLLSRDINDIAIYTRNDFRYPQLTVVGRLPSMSFTTNETFQTFYIGVENGGAGGNGLIALYKQLDRRGISFNAIWYDQYGWNYGKIVNLDVTYALPSNNETANNQYIVRMHRNIALLEVNGNIVAMMIPCNRVESVKSGVKPYSIGLIERLPERISPFIEWGSNRTIAHTTDLYVSLFPSLFRVSEGPEIPILDLPLYVDSSGTKLIGYTISSNHVTSHPFPIAGFEKKTLYFMANQSGTLEIDIYTYSGNWRTYDTISVTSNTLHKYSITDDAVLARIVFTPGTYPATINEAEIFLS